MKVLIDEQVACAKRELALRRNVYPKRVATGAMKQTEADKETARMAAIVATLELFAKYPEAFRRLATELITAEQSPEAAAIRTEFPGAKIADERKLANGPDDKAGS